MSESKEKPDLEALEAQISLKYFDLEEKYTEIGEIYRDIARLRMRRHTQTLRLGPIQVNTRRPCPVKDPAQDKDACKQLGSDACQWNTDSLVDCHYVRGDPVDVTKWLHAVDVVKWEVVEKMIQDPSIPPAIVAYWTKALKLHREGMLTDIEIIKRLKETD